MSAAAADLASAAGWVRPRGLAQLLGWRRVLVTLGVCLLVYLPMAAAWQSGRAGLLVRMGGVALLAMLAFGLFEQWPRRLPRWLARWVLQVVAVAFTVPVSLFAVYVVSTEPGAPPFWRVELRLAGFGMLTVACILVAPWVALGALVRQREAFAREQALSFQLERSRLEHQALDARMRLLQAQVQPHFLFNTLANVRALVTTGSPHASTVLDSLIAYLRAAVPRLDERATTLGQEAELVRAYLDLMQLRMPDRLRFTLEIEPAARELACPPMTLMTLVENAVRHGIDPAEDGGCIELLVRLHDDGSGERCRVCVSDTGVGLRDSAGGSLGTGLAALRERLQLSWPDGNSNLSVVGVEPHGVRVTLDFPARRP